MSIARVNNYPMILDRPPTYCNNNNNNINLENTRKMKIKTIKNIINITWDYKIQIIK
jgi:hypothetical protein